MAGGHLKSAFARSIVLLACIAARAQQPAAKPPADQVTFYLRAYLVPDPTKGSRIDMEGWTAAYGEVFGTAANPTKPARSTVGVSALVNADWLIEIEAVAVFPK
jgi:hypothetical protein